MSIQNKRISSKLCVALAAIFLTISAQAEDLNSAAFEKAMGTYLSKGDNVEKMANAIQSFFQKKREEEGKAAAMAEGSKMEEQFKNPVKIDIGDSPVKGKADAKVTVIAFSDFQCPFCSKGKTIIDDLLKIYPNDVKVVFKNLPLDFHPKAKPAAIAALAAGNQGKFWEMHDYIFDNQAKLTSSESFFDEAATALGLDLGKFKTDLADPKIEAKVEADSALAKSLGVQGTPNFYVNGVNLRGAYPIADFKKIVDRWLGMKK